MIRLTNDCFRRNFFHLVAVCGHKHDVYSIFHLVAVCGHKHDVYSIFHLVAVCGHKHDVYSIFHLVAVYGHKHDVYSMPTFQEFFENPAFRPDGLKIYPTLVIRGTGN